MELVATLAIVLGAMAVVLWPLFGPRMVRATDQHWARDRFEALLSRRDSAYDAIRDLDFEYQLGNLSDGDYRELRERYREQAAGVLQTLDRFKGSPAPARDGGELHPATLKAEVSLPSTLKGGRVKAHGATRPPARMEGAKNSHPATLQGGGRGDPHPARRGAVADTCPLCGEHVDRWAAQCRWCGGTLEETP